LAIFVFGGDVIRGFTFALLVGIVVGTYSSLCIAAPVVVDFDKAPADKK
jgi:SecD/SecF fusion protein